MDDALTPAGRRVLDAAGTLFYAEGIGAVGVALVAKRAGVTKKTLYDCFGSKDELVVRYLRRRDERWWERVEAQLAAAPGARVLTLVDAYLARPEPDDGRGCAFLNAAAELPAGHPALRVVHDHKAAVRRRLAELVAEDRPDLGDAEADDLGELVYLVLEGATAHLLLGDRARAVGARRLVATHLAAVTA